MKTFLTIVLIGMLLFAGCTSAPNANPSATPSNGEPTQTGIEPSAAGNTAPAAPSQQTPTTPAQSAPDSGPKFTHPYVITALVLQYDDQNRIERWLSRDNYIRYDNLTTVSGIEVNIGQITDSPGFTQPLADPSKTIITLRAEDGTTYRLQPNEADDAKFAALPTVFWMLNPAVLPDTSTSHFLLLQQDRLLAPGTYNLSVDVQGNGTVVSKLLLVPGVSISSPKFASKQPVSGFDLSWSQAGSPQDFIYRIMVSGHNVGSGYLAVDESLQQTTLRVKPSILDDHLPNAIEPAIYLLNYQMEGGQLDLISGKELLDYYTAGYANQASVFGTINVKEIRFVKFKVGDFCHCDDTFLPSVCTTEELLADPLCN